jgi:hypothetical protein
MPLPSHERATDVQIDSVNVPMTVDQQPTSCTTSVNVADPRVDHPPSPVVPIHPVAPRVNNDADDSSHQDAGIVSDASIMSDEDSTSAASSCTHPTVVLRVNAPLSERMAKLGTNKRKPVEWLSEVSNLIRSSRPSPAQGVSQPPPPAVIQATILSHAFSARSKQGWVMEVAVCKSEEVTALQQLFPPGAPNAPKPAIIAEAKRAPVVNGEIREIPPECSLPQIADHYAQHHLTPDLIQFKPINTAAGQLVTHKVKFTVLQSAIKLLEAVPPLPLGQLVLTKSQQQLYQQHVFVERRATRMLCTQCGAVDEHTKKHCDTPSQIHRCNNCGQRGHNHCSKRIQHSTTACYICGGTGHPPKQCSQVWASPLPLKSYLDQQQHPRPGKSPRRRRLRLHSPSQPLAEYSAQRESSNAASNSDSSNDQWKEVNRRRKRTKSVRPIVEPPAPSGTPPSGQVATPPPPRLTARTPALAVASTPATAPAPPPVTAYPPQRPADITVNISREEYLSMQQQITELTKLVSQLMTAIKARPPSPAQSSSALAQTHGVPDVTMTAMDTNVSESCAVRKRARQPSPMTPPPSSTPSKDDPTGKHSEDEQKRDDSMPGHRHGMASSQSPIISVDASGQRSGSRALKALKPHRPNEASIFHTPAVTGRTRHQAGSHAAALSNG